MLMDGIKGLFRTPYKLKNVVGGEFNPITNSADANIFKKIFGLMSPDNATAKLSVVSGYMSYGVYMDVGFGDTAVTANDIKLSDGNMTIENAYSTAISQDWAYRIPLQGKEYLTVIGQSNNTKADGEVFNKTVVYRNDTEQNVTVKEIGLYYNVWSPATSTSSYWQYADNIGIALAFRKVLSTPITFAPGDVYAITYRIALDI